MLTMSEAEVVAASLLACPFCGAKPTVSIRGAGANAVNPKARCKTPECMAGKLPVINLDVPSDVLAWNTRA
jgi:hypothetical protein